MLSLSFLPLPNDVCEIIEFYLNSNAIDIIIKYWYKYINEKVNIINDILNLENYNPLYISNAIVFSNASKIISGNEDYDWWVNIIWTLTDNITSLMNLPFFNIQQKNSFNLSVYSCRILAHKFNILDQVDYLIQFNLTDNPSLI
tara:strand:+ start:61 stop:492 length:432 start_codon:yes stop_codon:yes gene_type:complete